MTIQINPSSSKYPTKMPTAIFLDSGGVINDNKRRAPQWLRCLGEFFPTTRLGGTAEVWSNANRQVVKPFFSRWHEYMQQATDEATNISNNNDGESPNVAVIFERIHLTEWMKQMCSCAAESLPELKELLPGLSDRDLFLLAKQAYQYTLPRVRADFPGAVDTIRKLSEETLGTGGGSEITKRYRLFTSSGDCFNDLESILKGVDAFEYFEQIYGSDRVNYLKVSPVYYERIFSREGIRVVSRRDASIEEVGTGQEVLVNEESDEVIVIDDSEKALMWARSLGARTVIIADEDVDLSLPHLAHIDYRLSSLSDLPALLEHWKDHFEKEKEK
ncbi:hypothetical protein BGZ52_003969 [Haplosporangium bisporale]|nr:hypothetical protein BGZ52_003969 [Haplosporangium bisporale]KAF9213441.1 hypothetical protein BGZ59_005339 [Podila verticillata]KFH64080.1 hypothetical protein MVEG_09905 [Podila verticillata NRRL 6337]